MDNIKGLLIFLVVFAHCLWNFRDRRYIDFLVLAVYCVHMPAFVFTSGFFSKKKNTDSNVKYLLSYLFLISIYIVLDLFQKEAPHILTPYYSEWYLVALVAWRLLSPYLKKSRWTLFALLCFAIVAGYWKDLGGNPVLSITKIIAFFPFFFAGYLLTAADIGGIRKDDMKSRAAGLSLLALTAAGILASYKILKIGMADVMPRVFPEATLAYAGRRLVVCLIAAVFILALLLLSPDRKLPILTKAGKNSFAVFLIHRPLTLIFSHVFASGRSRVVLIASFVFAVLALPVLGSDYVAGILDRFLSACTACVTEKQGHYRGRAAIAVFLSLLLTVPAGAAIYWNRSAENTAAAEENAPASEDNAAGTKTNTPAGSAGWRVMDEAEKARFEGAFRLLFCGDLILLEDQVRSAYTGDGYDFSENFAYTKAYISDADFAIGVFEGPLGGTVRNYSSSNYGDGKELYINFPDEWADAVKDAGFDLVSLANNHILDMGEAGKDRTIDVLRQKELDFVGAYKDKEEKTADRVKLFERNGIHFAVLSYTFAVNKHSIDDMMRGTLADTTNMIVPPSSPYYQTVLSEVRSDFDRARELGADLIVVLPHWGTQFADEPDDFQLCWQQTFAELGADIILGDHTHSVQPVSMDANGLFTLYCPGNYANIYREYNGDCSALVEVYIDPEEKTVIGGAIIPMWTSSSLVGSYRAVPIYTILTDGSAGRLFTTYDLDRVREVQKHITKTMLGTEIDVMLPQKRYFFNEDGFLRTKAAPIETDETMESSPLYSLLTESNKVCFVGDSVTEGTKNGGVPWYEPLEGIIQGEIVNCGWGAATTKTLLRDHLEEIVNAEADCYVIAIGTNDVRYRNEDCAMTPEEYVTNLQVLREAVRAVTPEAKFAFLAPWTSTDGDRVSRLNYREKLEMNADYSAALRVWAESTGDLYVDANQTIDFYLSHYPQSVYLIDYIHPNYLHGVALYSESALVG